MNTDHQSNHSSRRPPASGPSPMPIAASAAQMAMALARSAPLNRFAMIDSVAGMISAAPTPIAARTAITWFAVSASGAARLDRPNAMTPACRARLRPKRSASVPKTRSSPAKTRR